MPEVSRPRSAKSWMPPSELEQQMESAEQHIGKQAESVQMQAVLSHTDLLTSLPNRRAFDAELELCDRRSRGKGAYSTVVLVDLDQFARVNAQYGHQGGDVILRQAAATIKQLMNGKDLVARFGGDTFGILLHQTTLHDALPIVERIRTTLEDAQFSHGSLPLRMTASIGVAQLLPEEAPADVIRRGQESLAAAKQSGRQRLLLARRPGQLTGFLRVQARRSRQRRHTVTPLDCSAASSAASTPRTRSRHPNKMASDRC